MEFINIIKAFESVAVFYHAKCIDGIFAAWSAREGLKSLGITDVTFEPVGYNTELPYTSAELVLFVDFCPTLSDLIKYKSERSVAVIDHHQTAQEIQSDFYDSMEDYESPTGFMYATHFNINMQFSGASLTYDLFFPGSVRPHLLNHVEDYDLFRFAIAGTREINCLLTGITTLDQVDDLITVNPHLLILKGQERLAFKQTLINIVVDNFKPDIHVIHKLKVGFMPCMPALVSDACDKALNTRKDLDVVCGYEHDLYTNTIKLSFRSLITGHAKLIAEYFGGGGHPRAAGSVIDYPLFRKLIAEEL